MTKRHVYLAGPILGCTKGEANDWRSEMCNRLAAYDVIGISPLRCEPLVGERYSPQYADPLFGTARAIAAKNMMDVRMCDITLAYFPKRHYATCCECNCYIPEAKAKEPSLGTVCEIAWAHALFKPTIVVSEDPFITQHPVVNSCAGWMLDTLDQATELILGLLLDYTR